VLACEGCRDAAIGYGTPFISGMDSLNNEYKTAAGPIAIPPTLLITALAIVPDLRKRVSMDLKKQGSALVAVGVTRDELGGAMAATAWGLAPDAAGPVARANWTESLPVFRALHAAMQAGEVLACHDCSEGGFAVTLAEMAFAAERGLTADLARAPGAASLPGWVAAFSESCGRFVCEVPAATAAAFAARFPADTAAVIGSVGAVGDPVTIASGGAELIAVGWAEAKRAWQRPFGARLAAESTTVA
jgi:phosphoribosylformylglycinamidine synthase